MDDPPKERRDWAYWLSAALYKGSPENIWLGIIIFLFVLFLMAIGVIPLP